MPLLCVDETDKFCRRSKLDEAGNDDDEDEDGDGVGSHESGIVLFADFLGVDAHVLAEVLAAAVAGSKSFMRMFTFG